MTQHTVHNNKMETGAQHSNSRDTCSLSVLSESSRCYQENGAYLPNFHNTAKAEYYNPDTLQFSVALGWNRNSIVSTGS